MIEVRLRSRISDDELAAKIGKVLGPADFNLLFTGPARVLRSDGSPIATYLPGYLTSEIDAVHDLLSSIRLATDNRGRASGTLRLPRRPDVPTTVKGNMRTRARSIYSGTLGAVDPGPSASARGSPMMACRLTAWTGKHAEEWHQLRPLLVRIGEGMHRFAPARFAAQMAAVEHTHPDWRIPGTPFTTVTVNNTYSTGVHQDSGDLPEGYSTLAVAKRGAELVGGYLVLPRFRIAFEMSHGSLLLFDAHEWHGNAGLTCPHVAGDLNGPCPEGCERVSLVAYFRTKLTSCGSYDEEMEKASAWSE